MVFNKIDAFENKINLWINYINNKKFEIFHDVSDKKVYVGKIQDIILHHLTNLKTNFNTQFQQFPEKN